MILGTDLCGTFTSSVRLEYAGRVRMRKRLTSARDRLVSSFWGIVDLEVGRQVLHTHCCRTELN